MEISGSSAGDVRLIDTGAADERNPGVDGTSSWDVNEDFSDDEGMKEARRHVQNMAETVSERHTVVKNLDALRHALEASPHVKRASAYDIATLTGKGNDDESNQLSKSVEGDLSMSGAASSGDAAAVGGPGVALHTGGVAAKTATPTSWRWWSRKKPEPKADAPRVLRISRGPTSDDGKLAEWRRHGRVLYPAQHPQIPSVVAVDRLSELNILLKGMAQMRTTPEESTRQLQRAETLARSLRPGMVDWHEMSGKAAEGALAKVNDSLAHCERVINSRFPHCQDVHAFLRGQVQNTLRTLQGILEVGATFTVENEDPELVKFEIIVDFVRDFHRNRHLQRNKHTVKRLDGIRDKYYVFRERFFTRTSWDYVTTFGSGMLYSEAVKNQTKSVGGHKYRYIAIADESGIHPFCVGPMFTTSRGDLIVVDLRQLRRFTVNESNKGRVKLYEVGRSIIERVVVNDQNIRTLPVDVLCICPRPGVAYALGRITMSKQLGLSALPFVTLFGESKPLPNPYHPLIFAIHEFEFIRKKRPISFLLRERLYERATRIHAMADVNDAGYQKRLNLEEEVFARLLQCLGTSAEALGTLATVEDLEAWLKNVRGALKVLEKPSKPEDAEANQYVGFLCFDDVVEEQLRLADAAVADEWRRLYVIPKSGIPHFQTVHTLLVLHSPLADSQSFRRLALIAEAARCAYSRGLTIGDGFDIAFADIFGALSFFAAGDPYAAVVKDAAKSYRTDGKFDAAWTHIHDNWPTESMIQVARDWWLEKWSLLACAALNGTSLPPGVAPSNVGELTAKSDAPCVAAREAAEARELDDRKRSLLMGGELRGAPETAKATPSISPRLKHLTKKGIKLAKELTAKIIELKKPAFGFSVDQLSAYASKSSDAREDPTRHTKQYIIDNIVDSFRDKLNAASVEERNKNSIEFDNIKEVLEQLFIPTDDIVVESNGHSVLTEDWWKENYRRLQQSFLDFPTTLADNEIPGGAK
jgi:hypothetical protein